MTKRELVSSVLHGEKAERIPVGFWHHYLEYKDCNRALQDPRLFEKTVRGHQEEKKVFEPDFVKLMIDGLFFMPVDYGSFHSAADLKGMQVLADDNVWIERNVQLARRVRAAYGEDILFFCNLFAPMTQMRDGIRMAQGIGFDRDLVLGFLKEDPQAVADAMMVMAESQCKLIRRLMEDGLTDGAYYCVSNPFGDVPTEVYRQCIMPAEKMALAQANALSDINMLHICGNVGRRDMFELYSGYEASAVNWAAHMGQLSLKEGRELFAGRTILGGFDNSMEGVLYRGTKEEVEHEVEKIVAEVGRDRLILGADCTIPADIDMNRIEWVRQKAAAL